jgi:hypothetical protein
MVYANTPSAIEPTLVHLALPNTGNISFFNTHKQTFASWGSCTDCGDGYCDLTAESCSSCSSDCGSCSTSCGDTLCNGSETCSSCSSDCGVCGTEPIYTAAAYYGNTGTGGCQILSDGSVILKSSNAVQVATAQTGDKYHCVSLLAISSPQNGQTCISGVVNSGSNSDISPTYCVGTYNSRNNKCVYSQTASAMMGYLPGEVLTVKLNSINEPVWNDLTPTSDKLTSYGTWGRCSN